MTDPRIILKLKYLVNKYIDIFAKDDEPLTTNNFYEQNLETVDNNPVYIKQYRLPHSQKDEIDRQVKKMLNEGIIEPSISSYNSPLLLVPKNGPGGEKSMRLVVDYRAVNKKFVSDKFPLPRIEEILDQLGRAKYFSDLKSGFHQIPLDEKSRKITSFTTDSGSFQFTRLPFGLSVAPNSFQRMMNFAFQLVAPDRAFLYLDDLIIYGCSVNHHTNNLETKFKTCRDKNLKLNPDKCIFFSDSVTYLGHECTSEGVHLNPAKKEVLEKYPVPINADETKRFVAFANYYRKLIPKFAEICVPLNKLTRKNLNFEWTKVHQNAFEKIKKSLLKMPMLAYPDFTKPFIITTDASSVSSGAYIAQEFDGVEKPIAFASKAFTKGEANKSTIERELTAIHWAVNHFRPYIYGYRFKIKADHKPLVYLFSLKNPSSKLTRMRLDLEEYQFDIEYLKGESNVVSDALSRINVQNLIEIKDNVNKISKVETRSSSNKK